ncbi:response regulator [Phormidium sp. FACHB-592]|uniref:histidine kinase n=1 Tax=Stenomitos frigidus AS-A4 TaxID=2933935 RepID=A0ABV0KIT6_9CYAN|nr:response regulator [Phormidium sp. FACHB-592]MBD2078084.1 response regulator [Phormidium sp. FACHB-592]
MPTLTESERLKLLGNNRTHQHLNTPPLILIVDDNDAIRLSLRQAMESDGYRVIETDNGSEALDAYATYQPQIVLLDALMPGMDGFTCCRKLNALPESHSTPIIMVTSLDDRESVDRAFECGATDFVTKPIHWAVLRQRVRRLLQHVELHRQVDQFNAELEDQVGEYSLETRQRTLQLHRALEFEATLKRITDKVRDSLDESQILQTAVQELAWALDLGCCNASLYDRERLTSSVHYEYAASIAGYHNQVIDMEVYSELYAQLTEGYHFQFCSLVPSPVRGQVAMFACPMINETGTIGDLWLINPKERSLSELEIRLVQQVANQCAIAVRQARLYQASQAQVQELERLSQLKDDFLSTVSHELRTPLSNIRLAIQMLERSLPQDNVDIAQEDGKPASKCHTYLKILHDECEREISLISDLLELQHLEVKTPLSFETLNLYDCLPAIATAFHNRAQQQQTLQVVLQPGLPSLITDLTGLRRILIELLDNACKYTPSDQTITLAASATPTCVELKVSNTGVEISADERTRIFEKFYRIPSSDPWKQGGIGLGLALVKRLVTHLKGSIHVESSNGQTHFIVALPRMHADNHLEQK